MRSWFPLLAAGLLEIVAGGPARADSPNEYPVYVQTHAEIGQWGFDYKDADTLLKDTQSPAFRKLKIGSTADVIYSISRDDTHLRLVVVPKQGGVFDTTSVTVQDEHGNDVDDERPPGSKYLPVLCVDVKGPGSFPANSTETKPVELLAWTVAINDWFRGMIVIEFKGRQGLKRRVELKIEIPWA